MADYTYAASSGKTYDDFIKEAEARALAQTTNYTTRANAANTLYKSSINSLYDDRIKAQEQRAAEDTAATQKAYAAQFDANAASALARERHLKEQMAGYGLEQSGYNATNQTALAVARGNADAATRAARSEAVEAIAQDLRDYRNTAEAERAAALAESDRDTATRVAEAEKTLYADSHEEAMDRLEYDGEQQKFAYEQEQDKADRAEELKQYVEDHNQSLYDLMLDAYNSGNTALAEEYAKSLWKISESGTIVPMTFSTTGASQYVKEQTAFEKQIEQQKVAKDSDTTKTNTATGYDEFGFPRKYSDYITEARTAAMTAAQTKDLPTQKLQQDRALSLVYLIDLQTKNKGSEGYMDRTTFYRLLRYIGLSREDYDAYVKSVQQPKQKESAK